MGKFAVVGDLHITHKSLDRTKELFALVEEIGLPVIWLGDMLDTKEVIRGKCFNLLLEYFMHSKLHHYVLVGNHDYFNLECDAHALETFKMLPNVQVIDEPTQINYHMVMFPYIHDRVVLTKELKRWEDPEATLFAHLDVEKFDYGNGHISTSGIPLSALNGFRNVISGHFHKYQREGNLTFLGTPMSKDFGESNQVKYLGMFDPDSGELKIASTDFPRHITLEINADEPFNKVPIAEKPGKDTYRVVLTGSQQNIDKFPKELFAEYAPKWIMRPTDYSENSVAIEETASNEKQFIKWATEIKKMDSETVELGLSILGACR